MKKLTMIMAGAAALCLAAGKISALMNPATYLLINLAIIALVYTGARIYAGV